VKNLRLFASGTSLTVAWNDPDDLIIDTVRISEWGSTKLVRKVGDFPIDEHDGYLVAESTTRNQFAYGFEDSGRLPGRVYCYGLFPTSVSGAVNRHPANRISGSLADADATFNGGRNFDGTWLFDGN
jgi:hypothetical protein